MLKIGLLLITNEGSIEGYSSHFNIFTESFIFYMQKYIATDGYFIFEEYFKVIPLTKYGRFSIRFIGRENQLF